MKNNKWDVPVEPKAGAAEIDSYLNMDLSQLRCKVRDLLARKEKNRTTINALKNNQTQLTERVLVLEKENKSAKNDMEKVFSR